MGAVFDRIDRHLDKELFWILTETSSAIFRKAKEEGDGTVRRGVMCKAIARSVGAALIEREGDLAKDIELSEFEDIAWKAAGSGRELLGPDADAVCESIAELCVAYMEMRKMGIAAPYPGKKARSYHDDYNPFGNEGGFCNPMKLQMMNDD